MDADSSGSFLGCGAPTQPVFCSDLIFSRQEKPLLDWPVEPDCVSSLCVCVSVQTSLPASLKPQRLNDSETEDLLHAVDPNKVFPSGPPADPSSESDCSLSEDQSSPGTTVTDPAAVYQLVYDLTGLAPGKPEPGQENVISIELGEFCATAISFSVVCIHDNGARKGEGVRGELPSVHI